MYLLKNFQNGGGMGEVLKFVTLDGGLRKKTQKIVRVFCKNDSIFWLSFGLKDLFWAAKNAPK